MNSGRKRSLLLHSDEQNTVIDSTWILIVIAWTEKARAMSFSYCPTIWKPCNIVLSLTWFMRTTQRRMKEYDAVQVVDQIAIWLLRVLKCRGLYVSYSLESGFVCSAVVLSHLCQPDGAGQHVDFSLSEEQHYDVDTFVCANGVQINEGILYCQRHTVIMNSLSTTYQIDVDFKCAWNTTSDHEPALEKNEFNL